MSQCTTVSPDQCHCSLFSCWKRNRKPDSAVRTAKSGIRLLDEVAFIRSWIEKPLSMGAVTPVGQGAGPRHGALCRSAVPGPVIELGSGTGPVTEALVARGIDPSRLVLVEFNPIVLPAAAHALSRGDGDPGRRLSHPASARRLLREPAAAVVSGLPLQTKPFKRRLRLMDEAFGLMAPGAPFVQFTYAMDLADPDAARRCQRRSLRADLAEPAAGAGMGLPQGLMPTALFFVVAGLDPAIASRCLRRHSRGARPWPA